MDFFQRRNSALHLEDVALSTVAEQVGTPCYVYSRALIESNWRAYDHAFVSVGELERVLMAGGRPERVVFSGVAKTHSELERALQVGIHCFDVESIEELQRLSQIAQRLDKVASIAVRVNPDVDARTHPYIATGLKETKFGVGFDSAVETYLTASNLPNIKITGIAAHIGSQITEAAPFIDALECMLTLVTQLAAQGIEITHLDIGGGLGIRYQNEAPPQPQSLIQSVVERVQAQMPDLTIYVEPGRSIVGNAGVLLTKIEYLKSNDSKHFAVVDAGLNDILRPALYKAWQKIVPMMERKELQTKEYDVVGPVCETGDLLGSKRTLAVESGDVLVIMDAGAYGHVMSSNYNSRPRPPEVMVDGDQYHVVRKRETINQLLAAESVLPAN